MADEIDKADSAADEFDSEASFVAGTDEGLNGFLSKIPLTSIVALAFVLVGAYLALDGVITYEDYLVKTGIALGGLGVVGAVRVADKRRSLD